jgi:DNA polymerase III epsilon subunit-like protein
MFDCETFNVNLSFHLNRAWQVACIQSKAGKIEEIDDIHLKWDTHLKISKGAAEITKFNPYEFDKKAINAEDGFKRMDEIFKNSDYIVGHNLIGFDIYLVKGMYEYFGKDWKWILPKIIDTNCIIRGIKMGILYKKGEDFTHYQYKIYNTRVKGIKSSLGLTAKEFGINFDPNALHNAVEDLKVNLEVWNKLKWQIEI